jgi:2-dehydro-3-deoxy-D-gluconate 5-dehydrogenase
MMNQLQQMFSLQGKTAIVTGGGRGIGKGIAFGLAAAGADIVIADIDEKEMGSTAKEIRDRYGVRSLEVKADVQSEEQVAEMVTQTLEGLNGIDILVNNAGMGIRKLPQDMTLAEWEKNISINLTSVFICSKAVFPVMQNGGGGKIINISSLYSIFGVGKLPAYAASKGGVTQTTRSLAIAWAPDNIQVNAIIPGYINTRLSEGSKQERPELEEMVNQRTPAGRWGEPEDIAGTAVFLAAPASDFLTGVALPVDGGYSIMP